MRPYACFFRRSLKTQAEACFCLSNDSSRWRRDHAQAIQLKDAVYGPSANGWRPGPVLRSESQILGMDTRGRLYGHLMPHAKTSVIGRMFSKRKSLICGPNGLHGSRRYRLAVNRMWLQSGSPLTRESQNSESERHASLI